MSSLRGMRRLLRPGREAPPADEWLATPAGGAFELRRDVEAYGITCHCGGYLRRVG